MSKFTQALKGCKKVSVIGGIILGCLLILGSILLIAAYVLTPQLSRYHPELIKMLCDSFQRPVTVESMTAEWEGLGPVIQLQNVAIWDETETKELLNIDNVEVRVSLIDLVGRRALVPKAIVLDNPYIRLLQAPGGKIHLKGFTPTIESEEDNIFSGLEKIVEHDNIDINQATIEIELSDGKVVYIKNVDASLMHRFRFGKFEFSGNLVDEQPRGELNATITYNLHALSEHQWQGDINLEFTNADIASWMKLWPSAPVHVQSGKGDFSFTGVWDGNELIQLETSADLEQLSLQNKAIPVANNELLQEIKVLELSGLSGKGDAHKTSEGWSITGGTTVAFTAGGNIDAHGTLQLTPAFEESYVEFYANGNDIRVQEIIDILPKEKIPPKFFEWMNNSISNVTVQETDIVIRGPVKKFPFHDREGVFEVNADITADKLQFSQKWPPLTELQSQIIFKDSKFYAILNQGKIGGGNIIDGAVIIPEIKKEGLVVNVIGSVDGTAEKTVAFLKETPLWVKLQNELSLLKMSGPVQVALDIDVGITEPKVEDQVFGSIDFFKATIEVPSQDFIFTEVIGELNFDKKGIYADNLTAKLYNNPVNVQIATQLPANAPSYLKLALQGDMNIVNVQKRYPSSMWSDWQGTFPFQADMEWHMVGKPSTNLKINSNLQGLKVNLPQPFSKPANQPMAFTYSAKHESASQHQQIQYGKLLNADLYYTKIKGENHLSRGLVQIQPAAKSSATVPNQGVQIVGQMPTLDLDAWIPRLQNAFGDNSSTPTTVSGKLQLENIKMLDRSLRVNTLNFQRLSEHWKTNFSGKDVQGQVLIPHNLKQTPIDISLNYLFWTSADPNISKKETPPPDNFPNFNVDIKKFNLNGLEKGNLKIGTKMGQKMMTINPLRLQHLDYSFIATGRWDWSNNSSKTSVKGKVTTKNLGGMLKTWNLSKGMTGGKGDTLLDVSWQGGPGSFDLDDLSGEVVIDWHNGRLVDVNPGIGRILSLFSVQSLARRLTLDFSDVFKKGFTFDRVKSNLNFNQGVVSTKNGEVKSTSGVILFNGKAYTVTQTLDLNITVTPMLPTTSIAAGVAVLNPLIGAAAFAADKAVVSPVTKTLIKTRYHVTGPWQDPIITPVKGK